MQRVVRSLDQRVRVVRRPGAQVAVGVGLIVSREEVLPRVAGKKESFRSSLFTLKRWKY